MKSPCWPAIWPSAKRPLCRLSTLIETGFRDVRILKRSISAGRHRSAPMLLPRMAAHSGSATPGKTLSSRKTRSSRVRLTFGSMPDLRLSSLEKSWVHSAFLTLFQGRMILCWRPDSIDWPELSPLILRRFTDTGPFQGWKRPAEGVCSNSSRRIAQGWQAPPPLRSPPPHGMGRRCPSTATRSPSPRCGEEIRRVRSLTRLAAGRRRRGGTASGPRSG